MTQKSKSWKVLETVANHLKESNHQGSTNQRVESGEMSVLTTTDLLVSLPRLISRDLERPKRIICTCKTPCSKKKLLFIKSE